MEKVLKIVQENNGFGFAAGFAANPLHRDPPRSYQEIMSDERFTVGARARGTGPALFLAYKVVLE
jgi:hypothetical protein